MTESKCAKISLFFLGVQIVDSAQRKMRKKTREGYSRGEERGGGVRREGVGVRREGVG